MEVLKIYIFIATIFINSILYSTLTFLGFEFVQPIIWTIIKIAIFVIVISFFIKDIIETSYIPKGIIGILYLLFSLVVLHLFFQTYKYLAIDSRISQDLLIFVSRGIPVFLVGLLISKNNKVDVFVKHLQVVIIYVSLAITLSFFYKLFITGNYASFGGANYQAESYMSSVMLGMNLYYAFILNKKQHLFDILKNNSIKFLHLLFVLILLLNIFSTGGRGGAVVGIFYILVTLKFIFSSKEIFKIILIISLILLSILIIQNYLEIPQFEEGFKRAFSFIGGNHLINLEESNREMVYMESIKYILNSPIFGYGLGTYYNIIDFYPHNLILLLLFEGGIIYLLFYSILFMRSLNRILKVIRIKREYLIILYIVSGHFILLMFSGTYLRDDISWLFFGISYGLMYNYLKLEKL